MRFLIMALACGATVANIYICQPLLGQMAQAFAVPPGQAGLVQILAQAGYATGILMAVPLADTVDPRKLVRVLLSCSVVALAIAASAPNVGTLAIATYFASAFSVLPQILIPLGAAAAAPDRRGRVIALLQTGVILGILMSRAVAGTLAEEAGTWRAPYGFAAILDLVLVLLLPRFIPSRSSIPAQQSYLQTLASITSLLGSRDLRLSIVLGFCLFGAFSIFWSTVSFHVAQAPFLMGSKATGLLSLWGALGVMCAYVLARKTDSIGSFAINVSSIVLAALAFATAVTFGADSFIGLVVAINLLDLALQIGQVANQSRIFALDDRFRARFNSAYMFMTFMGGAAGSTLGVAAWTYAGWHGASATAFGFVLVAAVALMVDRRHTPSPGRKARDVSLS